MKTRDMLHLTACSDLRRNILLSLIEHEKSLRELREELEISSTTALHALKELEVSNLTFQTKKKSYRLTNIGRTLTLKLLDLNNAVKVLTKHERFWLDHDISGIPEHMLEKIGFLKDSSVIQINILDIVKTHDSYVNIVKNAKWIRGVSPIFSSDYPIVFKDLVKNNVDTHLILTEAVFKKLIDTISLETFKNLEKQYPLKVIVCKENLKVAFTVTDTFLSLGLFNNDGIYDTSHDLICTDNKGIRWGLELFEHFQKKIKENKI